MSPSKGTVVQLGITFFGPLNSVGVASPLLFRVESSLKIDVSYRAKSYSKAQAESRGSLF